MIVEQLRSMSSARHLCRRLAHSAQSLAGAVFVVVIATACAADGRSVKEVLLAEDAALVDLAGERDPEEYASCVSERTSRELGLDDAARVGEDALVGPTRAQLRAILAECSLSEEEAPEPVTGKPLGGSPLLDGLWDACSDGHANACDQLFLTSAAGSVYEWYGRTCGDRGGGDCSRAIDGGG